MRCGYPRCKDCPVKITIEGAGQIKVSSESLLKCCRVKEQLKWAKKKMNKENKTTKIKRNAVKCLICNDIIESTHRHDFVICRCGACFVDGGHSYIRRGGQLEHMEDLTEYEVNE